MTAEPLLVLLDDDERDLLRKRLEVDREIRRLTGERDVIDDRLKEITGNAEAGVADGKVLFTWSPVVSKVLDQKALKEYAPEIADRFTVERVTRPFRITKEAAEVLG